jgi:hypothetical protein
MTTHDMLDAQSVALPTDDDVGNIDTWTLPSGDTVLEVYARFLGFSSSYQPQHYDHVDAFAQFDERCRACRWFEPRIFREVNDQRRYLIHRTGCSSVPGEVMLTAHEWVRSPHEVIEALTTRRRNRRTGDRTPYLTQPAARVLAQAAAYDKDLTLAYIDRAVV